MGLGMGAAEKAVAKSAQQTGGDGKFLPNIFWKDDKAGKGEEYKKVVRFLSDDVVTAGVYEFVTGGEADAEGKKKGREFFAPETLVYEEEVRDTNGELIETVTKPIWPEIANERNYFRENNIQLPNFKGVMKPAKAADRTVALVVLRDERYVADETTGRRKAVYSDLKVDRKWTDKDGVDHEESGPQFGIVRQGHKNFWSTLVGYYARFGTICDRDYEIVRQGEKLDTTYIIIPLDPDPELDTPEKVTARYFDTKKNDDGTVEVIGGDPAKGKCPATLKDYILPRARYDAVAEWLGGKKGPVSGGETGNGSSSQSAKTETDYKREERNEPVRESASGGSLRDELESYAK